MNGRVTPWRWRTRARRRRQPPRKPWPSAAMSELSFAAPRGPPPQTAEQARQSPRPDANRSTAALPSPARRAHRRFGDPARSVRPRLQGARINLVPVGFGASRLG